MPENVVPTATDVDVTRRRRWAVALTLVGLALLVVGVLVWASAPATDVGGPLPSYVPADLCSGTSEQKVAGVLYLLSGLTLIVAAILLGRWIFASAIRRQGLRSVVALGVSSLVLIGGLCALIAALVFLDYGCGD